VKYTADVNIMVRVTFEDDGGNNLRDQALGAIEAEVCLGDLESHGMELVGKIEPVEAKP
jgi:hypothetical protein